MEGGAKRHRGAPGRREPLTRDELKGKHVETTIHAKFQAEGVQTWDRKVIPCLPRRTRDAGHAFSIYIPALGLQDNAKCGSAPGREPQTLLLEGLEGAIR